MNKKYFCAALAAALCLMLAACGGSGGASSSAGSSSSVPVEPAVSVIAPVETPDPEPEPEPDPEPEPEPEPVLPYVNPLTGEGCETDIGANRPIAIMLNNHKKAQPQAGVSQADIIYELVAEGGITRMMGVFQSAEGVGEIGTVRSARDYYVSLAYGHDAIFLHAGGSPQAYDAIQDWGVTALDCVNGPYEGTLFWRDKDRRANAGLEHSVLTSGDTIQKLLPTYKRVTLAHKSGYENGLVFMEEGKTAKGVKAETISVRFSGYKTGVFRYDADTGLYNIEQFGKAYTDANTGEQVAVKNVLVLFTEVENIKGDDKGRQTIQVVGSGNGQFFCDGVGQAITWSKKSNSAPLTYTTSDGQPLELGIGHTYINIVDSTSPVTVE